MLSRFVRIQLIVFGIVSVIGMTTLVLSYIEAPTLLGIGRMTITVQLPAAGGLYRFSNVTYRGVQVGKVTDVTVLPGQVRATLSIDAGQQIPANLQAEVRSVSAVGEQYVDLRPRTDGAPFLHDGSVIAKDDTTIPQPVGPVLDQLSALVGSIPKDKLAALLDESFKGLNGAGYDFGSLLDSSSKLSGALAGVAEQARTLTDDAAPFLDAQAQSTDAIRAWSRGLAGFTGQLVTNDAQLRTLLETAPGAADEISRLLNQIKPTLPVLLANLTTVGQVAVTYNAALRQLLVLLPPYVADTQTTSPINSPDGLASGEFSLMNSDPPPCTIGFLPPSQWRSPAETTTIDTPDGLYCKLPQDSPVAVRGARNYPCMGHPGKRAPTVEICDSDKPFLPLALRPHTLGPYPLDPNLIAQGIPPDDRVNLGDNLYAPPGGTSLPPGVAAPPGPPLPGDPSSLVPMDQPPPGPDHGVTPVAPSSFGGEGAPSAQPSVAVARYDPGSGRYVTADGQSFRQSDLVINRVPQTWQNMLATG